MERSDSIAEFKIFLGLLLDMGLDPKPRLQDYWRATKTFTPTYGKLMSRDRFLLILRCIYCGSTAENDRLNKVRYLVDYFNNKMMEVYNPQKNLCIDKGMVLWRGRLYIRQYVKGKLYMLCDPHGLIMRFLIYCGVLG